mmetsp:Transcript_35736/g.89780  ORF Transcript_35736/g.89780 Transcript_35736/m.89780 type:complete len:212 (+) Transcript_35736:359-994(+)
MPLRAAWKRLHSHDVHLEALASLAGLPKLVARSLPGFVNNKRLQVTLVVLKATKLGRDLHHFRVRARADLVQAPRVARDYPTLQPLKAAVGHRSRIATCLCLLPAAAAAIPMLRRPLSARWPALGLSRWPLVLLLLLLLRGPVMDRGVCPRLADLGPWRCREVGRIHHLDLAGRRPLDCRGARPIAWPLVWSRAGGTCGSLPRLRTALVLP